MLQGRSTDIKRHKWFKGVDWDMLVSHKVTPPRKPKEADSSKRQQDLAKKYAVEKPPQGTAPSNLSVLGRYILQPEIFDILSERQRGAGGEIQLTDAMAKLMGTQDFHALDYDGESYDCGDRIGWLRANVALTLKRPDLADAARAALTPLLQG